MIHPSRKGSACTPRFCPATNPIPTSSSVSSPKQITAELVGLCAEFFR